VSKLILYGVLLVVVLLVWLLVWLAGRRQERKAQSSENAQATLVGYHRTDGAVVGERVIQNGMTVKFDPPIVVKPGESMDITLYFAVPRGCKPAGDKWKAFPLKNDRTVKN